MRLPLLPMAALAAALLSPMALQAPLAAAPEPRAQARVIVTFKVDAPLARRQALAATGRAEAAAQLGAERANLLGKRLGLALRGGGHVSARSQVMFADGVGPAQLVRRLAADSEVESVVVDQRRRRLGAPNDTLYAEGQPDSPGPVVGQWYLRAPAGAVASAIDAEAAWAVTTGRPEVVVAVVDTGVRFDHPDLTSVAAGGSLLPGYDMIADVAVAGDGDGRDADASDPGDFVSEADIAHDPSSFSGCTVEDSSWHGTQTASLIGALTDNGIGMASLGRTVRVLPLRVLGKCGGYDSDIQAAMRWAAGLDVPGVPLNEHKAAVINLSLGSAGACGSGYPAVIGEVIAAGTAIVASAGNSTGHAVGLPANCAGVIAVGGLRHAGTKVGFSDLGPEIALSAPAGNCINVGADEPCLYPIITALNAGTTTPVAGSSAYSDSLNFAVGTSYSAPLAAATAALMLSVQPALPPADIRRLLQASARPFPNSGGDNGDGTPVPVCRAPDGSDQLQCYCTTGTCGAGMLDAGAAVQAAQNVVVARIAVTPEAPLAGQAIELSAATSAVAIGRTIASVHWVISDAGGIVDGFSSGADALTASVVATAAGRFGVSVTVIDDLGHSGTAESSIDVQSDGGGGGGGATGLPWLVALALSVVAVARVSRRGARESS
jgi:serine protease